MVKRPELPSWDELNRKPELPTRRSSNVPTYDEIMFGRDVEARVVRNQEEQLGWDITIPSDVGDAGTQFQTAPTINPRRPRALTVGYNSTSRTLIVIFRDNTWWQYNNVPADMWVGLKNSASTGKYLKEEGLDTWPDMGPASMDDISDAVKAQLSSSAQTANNIQNSNTVIEQKLKGVTNLRSFTAEELFKEYL
jgi:hypothetical protein